MGIMADMDTTEATSLTVKPHPTKRSLFSNVISRDPPTKPYQQPRDCVHSVKGSHTIVNQKVIKKGPTVNKNKKKAVRPYVIY